MMRSKLLLPVFLLCLLSPFAVYAGADDIFHIDAACDPADPANYDDCVDNVHLRMTITVDEMHDRLITSQGKQSAARFERSIASWEDALVAECDIPDNKYNRQNCEYVGMMARSIVVAHLLVRFGDAEDETEALGTAKLAAMARIEQESNQANTEQAPLSLDTACDDARVLDMAVANINAKIQKHGATPNLIVTGFRDPQHLPDVKQAGQKYCKATATFNTGQTDSALIVLLDQEGGLKVNVLPNDAGY